MPRFYEPTEPEALYEGAAPSAQAGYGVGRRERLETTAQEGEEKRLKAKEDRAEIIRAAAAGELSAEEMRALSPTTRRMAAQKSREPVAEAAPVVEAGSEDPALGTAADAGAEDEIVVDPIETQLRAQYDLGMVEADRAQRAFAAMEERHRHSSEQVEREITSAETELKNYSIDPKRAYGSTGNQVAAAFAIAIGAFAEGLSGGKVPNTAFKIIDNAIKRDIDAQKAEMGKYKDVMKNKNNVYARMLQKFGNERVATAASIQLGLSAAGASIDELAAKFPPGSKQAQVAAGFKAKLAGQYAKGMLDLKKINGQILGKGSNSTETQGLFKNALREIGSLRKKFIDVPAGQAVWSQFLGFFGEEAQVTYSSDEASRYAAARFAVAQFVNKAFSGARGSDRDLAAVMARIPQAMNAALDKTKGLKLIADLEGSLKAAAGAKGYLVKGDLARHYESDFGAEALDGHLKTFQPEISKVQGRGS
tara:strand:- start:941 stop:2374 length:1434 start_codon:yes stop_codon:yes gene_type:complete